MIDDTINNLINIIITQKRWKILIVRDRNWSFGSSKWGKGKSSEDCCTIRKVWIWRTMYCPRWEEEDGAMSKTVGVCTSGRGPGPNITRKTLRWDFYSNFLNIRRWQPIEQLFFYFNQGKKIFNILVHATLWDSVQ